MRMAEPIKARRWVAFVADDHVEVLDGDGARLIFGVVGRTRVVPGCRVVRDRAGTLTRVEREAAREMAKASLRCIALGCVPMDSRTSDAA